MNNRILFPLLALLTLAACKKDKPADPAPAPPGSSSATVRLALEFVNGDQPFNMNGTINDGQGNPIRITTLKYYMSAIHLTDDDGAMVAEYPSNVLLVDAESDNTFTLGSVNPGHIHQAHFTLGLANELNYADPTAAEHPLNIPGMHWSWNTNAGYKFLNLEGYVDVNENGVFDEGTDIAFTYHCAQNQTQAAENPVIRSAHIMAHSDVVAGATLTIEARLDMTTLLNGVDLAATPVAMGNGPGNQLLMDNLVNAIGAH